MLSCAHDWLLQIVAGSLSHAPRYTLDNGQVLRVDFCHDNLSFFAILLDLRWSSEQEVILGARHSHIQEVQFLLVLSRAGISPAEIRGMFLVRQAAA
jgi:hypothetical protein